MKTTFCRVGVLISLLICTACGGGAGAGSASNLTAETDLTGTWVGVFKTSTADTECIWSNGQVSLQLQQSGSSLTGSITYSGISIIGGTTFTCVDIYNPYNTPFVEGAISGTQVSFFDAVGSTWSMAATGITGVGGTLVGNITSDDNHYVQGKVVLARQGGPPALTGISISSPGASHVGLSPAFTASGTFTDGTTQNITNQVSWSSTNTAVATINAGGVASALSVGSTTIGASLDSISASVTLSVGTAALQSISIAPGASTILSTQTVHLTATGHYSDGTTSNLTSTAAWSSSTTATATVAAGVLTPHAAGTTTVTATSVGISGSAVYTVDTQAQLVSVVVAPSAPSIAIGLTQPMTATANWSSGPTTDVTSLATWTSGTPSQVTVNSATGLAYGVALGSSTVTATYGTTIGNTLVTVTAAVLQSIAITPSIPGLVPGGTQAFLATGNYSGGSNSNLTSTSIWTSSNPGVATINSSGVATAVAPGSTTITSTSAGVSGSATLLVGAPGSIWGPGTSGTTRNLMKIKVINGVIYALGQHGIISSSTDGQTWTNYATPSGGDITGLAYNGTSTYIAVDDGGFVSTSSNGTVWTTVSSLSLSQLSLSGLTDVIWTGSMFVAVGDSSANITVDNIYTSPDGVTWTPRYLSTWPIYQVVWSGSILVAVGESGKILTSPDGVTWTFQTSGTANDLTGIVWTGSLFVAVGGISGTVLTSANGTSWTTQSFPAYDVTTGRYNAMTAVAWSGSLFVAVGSSGVIYTSPNATTWTQVVAPSANELLSVTYSSALQKFITVGYLGIQLNSP